MRESSVSVWVMATIIAVCGLMAPQVEACQLREAIIDEDGTIISGGDWIGPVAVEREGGYRVTLKTDSPNAATCTQYLLSSRDSNIADFKATDADSSDYASGKKQLVVKVVSAAYQGPGMLSGATKAKFALACATPD